MADRNFTKNFDVIRWYKVLFTKDPVIITVSVTVLLSVGTVYFSWGTYVNEMGELWVQLVAEAHGMILDILVICILFVWINKISDRKKLIAICLEDIEDLRLRNSDIQNIYQGDQSVEGGDTETGRLTYNTRSTSWTNSEYVRLKVIKAIKVLSRNKVTELDLHNVNVSGGRFLGINLKNSKLTGALVNDCTLDYANLSTTECCDTNFNGSAMDHVNMANSKAIGASFVGASLNSGTFNEANLIAADFTGAFLNSSKFRMANCAGAIFAGAHLIKVDFRGALNLTAHQIMEAKYISDCHFDPSLEKSMMLAKQIKKKLTVSSNGQQMPPMQLQSTA